MVGLILLIIISLGIKGISVLLIDELWYGTYCDLGEEGNIKNIFIVSLILLCVVVLISATILIKIDLNAFSFNNIFPDLFR